MGQKVPAGLIKRGGIWHIQKGTGATRIRESTGTSDLAEAQRYLTFRLEQIRQVKVYGVRPEHLFRQAATKYLRESTKTTLADDAIHLKWLDPFIGSLPLNKIHMGTLQGFIQHRRAKGVKTRTINHGLQVVRHILNLAAGEWLDESGITWLEHPPRIKFLTETDRRSPYPLSFEEQDRLIAELPSHLANMVLFKVNTGCREAEVCHLRWEWEEEIPSLNTSVFVIPPYRVKNRDERLVIMNSAARAVVDSMRGIHPEYVFTYRGHPIQKMNGPPWRKARQRAGLPQARVHDLKHTFGRRLRAAGVSFEDRQDLLGHRSGKVTTHYSAPELLNLIRAAERGCARQRHKIGTMVILKGNSRRLTAVK